MSDSKGQERELLGVLERFRGWRTNDELDEQNLNGHRQRLELIAALAGFWPGAGGLHPAGPSGCLSLADWIRVRPTGVARTFEVLVAGILGVTPAGRLLASEQDLRLVVDLGEDRDQGPDTRRWILARADVDGVCELVELDDLPGVEWSDGVLCAQLLYRDQSVQVDPSRAPPVLSAGAWEAYRHLAELARAAWDGLSRADRDLLDPLVAVLSGADPGDPVQRSTATLWRTTPDVFLAAQRSLLRSWPSARMPLRLRSFIPGSEMLATRLEADWEDVQHGTSPGIEGDTVPHWQRCMADEFAVDELPGDLYSLQVRRIEARDSSISLISFAAENMTGSPNEWGCEFVWEGQSGKMAVHFRETEGSGTRWRVAEDLRLSVWPVKMTLTRGATPVDRPVLLHKIRTGAIAFWRQV
jgi:hypothetical protein